MKRMSNPYKNKPDRWSDSGFTAGEEKPTECKTKYWKGRLNEKTETDAALSILQ